MTLLKFLDNIKRKGTFFRLLDENEMVIYQDTLTSFSHWIHNSDYYQNEIDLVYWNRENIMCVRLM